VSRLRPSMARHRPVPWEERELSSYLGTGNKTSRSCGVDCPQGPLGRDHAVYRLLMEKPDARLPVGLDPNVGTMVSVRVLRPTHDPAKG
jgi:hypothetical protein